MNTINSSTSPLIGGEDRLHVYTLCYFGPGESAPTVELFEALDDQDAVRHARARRPSSAREIWDRHRLVARINKRDIAS